MDICGEAYPIIKAVQKHLGGRLCLAFRDFPLINMHRYAEHAAEAAEAAVVQGHSLATKPMSEGMKEFWPEGKLITDGSLKVGRAVN